MSIQTQINDEQPINHNHPSQHIIDNIFLEFNAKLREAILVLQHRIRSLMVESIELTTTSFTEDDDDDDDDEHRIPRWGTRRPRSVLSRGRRRNELLLEDQMEESAKVRACMTKLLIAVAFTSVSMADSQLGHASFYCFYGGCGMEDVEVVTQWVAILLMMMGMYLRMKYSSVSKFLEIVGQLICVLGLMFMQRPFNQLPCSHLWIISLVVGVVLGVAMVVGC